MNLEDKIVEAIMAELKRQAADKGDLQVGDKKEGVVAVNGPVNLDALAMAVAGALAGGP